MERVDYEELKCAILPCFLYYEGVKKEEYWVDIQNCFYHKIDDDELWEKPHWIITPYKPTGTVVKEDDDPNIIRWFVSLSKNCVDNDKEWDFVNHCPKDDVMLLESESARRNKEHNK